MHVNTSPDNRVAVVSAAQTPDEQGAQSPVVYRCLKANNAFGCHSPLVDLVGILARQAAREFLAASQRNVDQMWEAA
jgi:hypothetical protein